MDDEPSILKQAKIFLENENERLNIDTAVSAERGLELLKQNEFDAIVSDYQMPEMDGLEFLEKVRKDKNSDIPFIIFTGRGREDVAMDALNLGADRYLQKRGDPKSQYGVLAQAIVQEVKRKKVESEKEKTETEERTEFLHSLLRHNLENRAQVVMGYLKKLKGLDLPEDAEIYLEEAIRTTDSQKELIEKVRTLRKVEEDEITEIEISSILDQVISDYEKRISEKNIELDYDRTECKVHGGPLLEELFSNLIENSIVHSGCDKLGIEVRERDKECAIIVTDNGKGIPDEKKEKVFDRGFKDGEGTGLGLGLYLVKRIIENYGGEVKVRDSKDGGARFDVILNKV